MTLNIDASVAQMLRESFGPAWTLEDDRRFWARMRGRQGLRKLKKDAKALEALCRRLSEDPNDRAFMKHRLQLMSVCLQLSNCEGTARIFYRRLPHFFARFAAELFSEMMGRAELVVEEKAPQLLEIFRAAHDHPKPTVADCAPAGRAEGRDPR